MRWIGNISRNGSSKPIFLILIFLFLTDIAVLLDIPVLRQILGFIFLSFVPGALFLCILKFDKLGYAEKFVLSVGLSISFLMFIGILINTIYPLFGYETPLSLVSLVMSLSIGLLIMAAIAHIRGGLVFNHRADLKLNARDKAIFIIPTFFIPMSVLGMHFMNLNDYNAMLLALLFLIPGYVILICIFHNYVPDRAYPIIIFLTSISLVLLMGMRSNHIIGADAHMEYYVFDKTFANGIWQILVKNNADSCLSVSILPVIYQSFLNINSEYLFKNLYPLLFSISPLVIYIIAKEYLNEIYALLAGVFFMSQNTFLSTAANPRTTIAILFLALSIMVLQRERLSIFEKRLLLTIFILSCIFSHYSTTYIFFIILFLVFILNRIIYRIIAHQRRIAPKLDQNRNNLGFASQIRALSPANASLTTTILLTFFVAIFVWHSQVTGTAFAYGVEFIVKSMMSLQDFFVLESRQGSVSAALGSGVGELEVPRKIRFVFNWLSIIFIAIGVLTTLSRYRLRISLPFNNVANQSILLKKKIDIMFFSFALVCSSIMAVSVAFPFISKGYGIDRIYLVTTIVLSAFFVLGGMTVAELMHVRRKYLAVLIVLVPFLMCATGVIYQLFDYPGSITLNSQGDAFDTFFIYDQESCSSKWIGSKKNNDIIYTDPAGLLRLYSQGLIITRIDPYSLFVSLRPYNLKGYVYLRIYFLNQEMVLRPEFKYSRSIIYNNGGSQIWV